MLQAAFVGDRDMDPQNLPNPIAENMAMQDPIRVCCPIQGQNSAPCRVNVWLQSNGPISLDDLKRIPRLLKEMLRQIYVSMASTRNFCSRS